MSFNSSTVSFFKMQGSGNDFILFDNTELKLPVEKMSLWAKTLCRRAFAVGADGMIFLDRANDPDLDFVWNFFNSDGSRAEMCGNGSRCASSLAYRLGLAGKSQVFGTDAGPIKANVLDADMVKVQLTPPQRVRLDIPLILDSDQEINAHFVNTGVPHTIVVCENVNQVDVLKTGRAIREHKEFSPSGTNVNFIEVTDSDSILLRTYERGVEAETFACGTGAAASVVIGNTLGLLGSSVAVTTSGKERLTIDLSNEEVFLTGKATVVYKAELVLASFGL
ncbi:MAG: diaminopimelate epimerase [Desulfovibrionales bacterium]|nr:diaminopimelate epimerase [Desulfovibrionales bacterium]